MADVFLSYSRGDIEAVRRFHAALSAEGLDVWWDDKIGAEEWRRRLHQALDRVACVAVLGSTPSAKSEWVLAEAVLARAKLVSVLIEAGGATPSPVNHIQWRDLSDWRGERDHAGFQWLLRAIQDKLAELPAKQFNHIGGLKKEIELRFRKSVPKDVVDMSIELLRAREADPDAAVAVIQSLHAGVVDSAGLELLARAGEPWTPSTTQRLHIAAPGGAGKSVFLYSLVLRAIAQGLAPFYADVRKAKPDEVSRDWLMGRLSATIDDLRRANQQRRGLLLADGLNETDAADEIIREINQLAAELPLIDILVADRMNVRTGLTRCPGRFESATLGPIRPEDIARLLQEKKGLRLDDLSPSVRSAIRAPFFLNHFLREGGAAELRFRFQIIEQYLARMLSDDFDKVDDEIDPVDPRLRFRLAQLAFSAYRDLRGPQLKAKAVAEALGDESRERLTKSGLLIADGRGFVRFQHQLMQDYLAARWMADSGLDASAANLDALSLDRAASEAVTLTAEIIAQRGGADEAGSFVTKVFDWDHAMALECVVTLGGAGVLDPGLRYAILALVSEKRYEPFLHSRARPRRYEPILAKALGLGKGFPADYYAYRKIVSEQGAGQGLAHQQWLLLFSTARTSSPYLVAALLGAGSLLGWTAANTLRRVRLSGPHEEVLRAAFFLTGTSDTVRWRIVHALGRSQGEEAVELLWNALWDGGLHRDVRYGAGRSCIEIALTGADPFASMLARLAAELDRRTPPKDLAADRRALSSLRNCALLASPPVGWAAAYRPILEAGARYFQADKASQDQWRRRIAELDATMGDS